MKTREEILEHVKRTSFGLLGSHKCYDSGPTRWYTFHLKPKLPRPRNLTVDIAGQLLLCEAVENFSINVACNPGDATAVWFERSAWITFRCAKVITLTSPQVVLEKGLTWPPAQKPLSVRLIWQDRPCITFSVSVKFGRHFTTVVGKHVDFAVRGFWLEVLSAAVIRRIKDAQ